MIHLRLKLVRRVAALLLTAMALLGLALLGLGLRPASALAGADDPAALIEAGHWKQARALLEPKLASDPNDAETVYLMSRVRVAFRDLAGAQKLAEQAVAHDGKNARYHEQLAMVFGEQAQAAGAMKAFGLVRRFRKEAEAAVALDPKSFDAQTGLMQFFQQAPGMMGGDKKKARAKADEILALDPVEGHLAHAELALASKDSTAAFEHLKKAVEADPASIQARLNLAGRLAAMRRYDEAVVEAREAQKLDSRRSGGYTVLAQLAAQQGRMTDLDQVLQQAEANVPDNRSAFYQAGRILLTENKELPRAEKYFRHYLEQEPEGNTPSLAHAHWRLGLVLEKEGRSNDAVAELESALKLKPDLDEAKKDLKRVKKQA